MIHRWFHHSQDTKSDQWKLQRASTPRISLSLLKNNSVPSITMKVVITSNI
jgi:hypothetical protein